MIFNISKAICLSQLHAHYDVAAFHGGGMMDRADGCAARCAEEQLAAESSADKVSKFTTTSDRNESLLTRIPGVPAITEHPTGPISALWDQSEDDSDEIRRLLQTQESFSPSLDLNFGWAVSLSDNPRLGDYASSATTPTPTTTRWQQKISERRTVRNPEQADVYETFGQPRSSVNC